MRRIVYTAWLVVLATTHVRGAITDGLVGYWPFEEGKGTNTVDASGNGWNGRLVNFPSNGSAWTSGQIGRALYFNGTNKVVVDDFTKPEAAMTLSAWVWLDLSSAGWIAANWGDSYLGTFRYGLASAQGALVLNVDLGQQGVPGIAVDTVSAGYPSQPGWHHVGFVADGTNLWTWLDGQFTGGFGYNGTFLHPAPTPELIIGDGWHGAIDEVALWVRALTADEIFDVYESGLKGQSVLSQALAPPPPPTPAVVVWGDDRYHQTEVPPGLTNAIAAAGGITYDLALDQSGVPVAWGQASSLGGGHPRLKGVIAVAVGSSGGWLLARTGVVIPWDGTQTTPPGLTNVIAISSGIQNLALKGDGTVVGWPSGVPAGLTNVIAISAGSGNSLVLTAEGKVIGWSLTGLSPNVPDGLTNVVGIAAGYYHDLALKADGTVVTWGNGYSGSGLTNVPTGLSNVIAIAASTYHSLALRADGTVVAWGSNPYGQTTVPAGLSNVVALDASDMDSLALIGRGPPMLTGRTANRVVLSGSTSILLAWAVGQPPLSYQWQLNGTNLLGATNYFLILTNLNRSQSGSYVVTAHNALGAASATNTVLTTVDVPPTITRQPVNQLSYPGGMATFSAMGQGSLPLTYQWFVNGVEIPGATNSTLALDALRPSQAGHYAVEVSNLVGTTSSVMATLSVGPVFAWGDGSEFETDLPLNLTNVTAIAAGDASDLALRADGKVLGWGGDPRLAFGIPTNATNILAIAAAGSHALALGTNGLVFAWGDDLRGQSEVPPGLTDVTAIAAGPLHSLAVRSDGTVAAWGDNAYGQTNVPPGLDHVVAVAAGGHHSVVLRATGRVVAWGDDRYGQTDAPPQLDNVVAIAAGGNRTLALRADGAILAWGDGVSPGGYAPVSLANAVAIAASTSHNLALGADGTVVGWGDNSWGETTTPPGLSNVIGIAAGAGNSLVLIADGSPTLVSLPTTRLVYSGGSVILNAGATGHAPLGYQWQLGGTNLPGQTNSWLRLDNVQIGDAGTYSVIAHNDRGAVTRDWQLVVQDRAPIIVNQPISRSVYPGGPVATLQVTAEGSAPLFYQWYFNGVEIPGATSSILTVGTPRLSQSGLYSVLVLNPFGLTRSASARLSVGPVVAWGTYPNNNSASVSNAFVPVDVTNAVAIAGGASHSLALTDDGRVIGWSADPSLPQVHAPTGLSNVVAIAAGASDSLAVRNDGSLLAWGVKTNNQLNVPAGSTKIVAAAAGGSGGLGFAVRADGTLVGWGTQPGQSNSPWDPILAIRGVDAASILGADSTPVVAVAVGGAQTIALREDGTVATWPLILGTIPHDLTNIIAVAAGRAHSLALRADGTVTAWGNGPGTYLPAGLTGVVAIAAGDDRSLALRVDGTVVGWGYQSVPPGLANVIDIASGPTHALALVGAGTLVRVSDLHLARQRWVSTGDSPWSTQTQVSPDGSETLQSGPVARGQESRLGTRVFGPGTLSFWWKVSAATNSGFLTFSLDGTNHSSSSAGADWTEHIEALPAGFRRLDWRYSLAVGAGGVPGTGWVGRVRFTPQGTLPPLIITPPINQNAYLGTRVTLHPGLVGVEPLSYQWQLNGIDLPGATNGTLIVPAVHATNMGAYSVSVSNAYGVAQSDAGLLSMVQGVGWGRNISGQTNPLASATRVLAIAAGAAFNVALRADGSVAAWGDRNSLAVRLQPSLSNAVAVAAGGFHALALKNDGTVVAWGDDSGGQSDVPVRVGNVVAIAAGKYFSLALTADGVPIAWGNMINGGNSVPAGLSNVVRIACGSYHAVALRSDGTVAAWGFDSTGQSDVPSGLSNVVAVAAGNNHTLALKSDGSVVAWGGNVNGAMQMPSGLTNIVGIAAGGFHSLALRADGTVIAWGQDSSGQSDVPIGLSNVLAVAAGYDHSLALEGDGKPPPALAPAPDLVAPGFTPAGFVIQVPAIVGKILVLEYEESLTNSAWMPLPLTVGDGTLKAVVDPTPTGSQRFYRIRSWR